MSYIAGHVTTHWSAVSGSGTPAYFPMGSTRTGVIERVTNHEQNVQDDAYGEAIPDAVQQGTDTIVTLTWIEYDLMKTAAALYVQTPLASTGTAGRINDNVGKLLSGLAGQLVITPIPGTPAETEMGVGKSKIYYKAIPITDIETPYTSKLREGPMTFRCLPDASNGGNVFRIITTPSFPNG